ncbi:MAG: hypothetical protein K0S41_3731 [Anaerocolumna sp.]|jgi:ribosomal-protein-alanine N-acetyltransferase|nr:hypothetical protein [Anaerocolumna sp.]
MCENDIPFVHEIEVNTFSDPWSRDDFKKSILDVNNLYLVVEENNEILGYCGFWGVVGEGQINNVAVKESVRGRGIARIMLNSLIQKGKEQGLEAFTLEVRVNNHPAISLYHSLGFKDAGIRKNFYEKPVEDALIMWL